MRPSHPFNPAKPYLSRDFLRSGKWQCVSRHTSRWGATIEVVGKGYSRREAYERWQRNWANPSQPWNQALEARSTVQTAYRPTRRV